MRERALIQNISLNRHSRKSWLIWKQAPILFWCLLLASNVYAQSDEILGVKLRPELQVIVKEIEKKTGEEIYAEFTRQEDFMFGSSYLSEDGSPVILIDYRLENEKKKLEAVVAHELLHLRLRVNNYPTFLFSPTLQTAKGLAVDTEQSTLNDLLSLIEHQVFKAEMERFELNKILNLAGDTARIARRNKNQADGQADSINYARAILEYPNPEDVAEVGKIYKENNWTRAYESGRLIAAFIKQSNPQTPAAVEAVFLKCILELYRPPSTHTFKFTVDPENKMFRRLIVSPTRKTIRRKSR